MPKTRKIYTDEFKRSVVSEMANSGKPISRIAADHKLAESLLYDWRKRYADFASSVAKFTEKTKSGKAPNPKENGVDEAFGSLATLVRAAPAYDAMLQRLYAALGRLTVENEMLREQLARKG